MVKVLIGIFLPARFWEVVYSPGTTISAFHVFIPDQDYAIVCLLNHDILVIQKFNNNIEKILL